MRRRNFGRVGTDREPFAALFPKTDSKSRRLPSKHGVDDAHRTHCIVVEACERAPLKPNPPTTPVETALRDLEFETAAVTNGASEIGLPLTRVTKPVAAA